MRMKKVLVTLLALALIVTGTVGSIGTNNSTLAAIAPIKFAETPEITAKPGETTHVKLSIAATDSVIANPLIEISAAEGAPFTFGTPILSVNGQTTTYVYAGSATTSLEFDLKTKETAEIGSYPLSIKFSYKNYSYIDSTGDTEFTLTTSIKITEEKVPAQLTVGNVVLGNSDLGSETAIAFTVINEGEIAAKNVYLVMNFGDIADERYTAKKIKIGELNSGDKKDVTLPITLLTSAGIGRKTITANFTYKNVDGEELTSAYNIKLNLTSTSTTTQTPKLAIDNITSKEGLKPGDSFNLSVAIRNTGYADAMNIVVEVDDASIDSTGIIKNYFTDGITTDSMSEDEENTVKVPLKVSKYATGGLKAVKVVITYTDAAGNSYTTNDTVYVDITSSAEATPTPVAGTPNIVVSNVKQSPAQPAAGDKVEVSFDVENKGKVDATDLKIATEGLSSTTFIPIESEPYLYYEKLKAGDKIRVTIPLIVSDSIVEGLNSITVKCTYADGESSAVIPIRDVINDGGISKPKLIVSKYYTDMEELRAGSTFNFTFDLYNTNATVAAKNITVTVSQADNIFTVTQGSNSFFIGKIAPGETVTQTMEMKVKSDASTKAYPIEILIEYEYDGAEPNPTTGEIGESKTEKLNLQAVENSRPVVDNVNVYSWDGNVMVGSAANLTFAFYNMGKSPLNNVIVKLEGDFTISDGEMYFIGNVAEGGSTGVDFEVIPNVEGTASGVLRITFEDSNGDEVEITKDFTAEVMGAAVIDPGVIDGGSGEVFNPGAPVVKEEILPVWAFVIMECVIFFLFVPITRKAIISIYKSKLRKKEQDQY